MLITAALDYQIKGWGDKSKNYTFVCIYFHDDIISKRVFGVRQNHSNN